MDAEQRLYEAKFLNKVSLFIRKLPERDRAKIAAQIEMMQIGVFSPLHIKTLRGSIKELIVKRYRIIFFIKKKFIYFIGMFIKKTQKTPKQEIDTAEELYKSIIK